MKNKKGFTLAEVLITLGIIGVVAALTIPTLIDNYKKTQYVTGLKKAYTEANQALVQMAADNGCVGDLKCTGFLALIRQVSLWAMSLCNISGLEVRRKIVKKAQV